MKKLSLVIVAIIYSLTSFSQQFEWAKSLGSSASSDQAWCTKTDAAGNVFMAGYFQGGFYFNPQSSSNLAQVYGGEDIFIAKYSPSGTLLWGKTIGGAGQERATGLAIDDNGNVAICGFFGGTADFDPGSASFNLTSAGSRDIFVVKLDANGGFLWANRFGSTTVDEANAVCFDPSGNVLLTGLFEGTVDFNPGSAVNNFSATSYDIFILKLSPNGSYIWNIRLGSNPAEQGRAIACDASGNVYTTGSYASNLDFDPGSGQAYLTTPGVYDAYLLKLDADGNFIWVRNVGGASSEFALSMALDADGSVILGGYFEGTAVFNTAAPVVSYTTAGWHDAFILKYSSGGTFAWARRIGSTGSDKVNGVSTDAQGNIYAVGYIQETVDLNTDESEELNVTALFEDAYLIKLNPNGGFVNAAILGGAGNDYAMAVSNDASGNIFVCGFFTGTADFNPGPEVNEFTSNVGFDIFLVKLGQCTATTGVDVQNACGPFTWIDGNTYTSNTTSATFQLTNVNGCDSIVTLNLSIETINVGVTEQAATLSANLTGAQYQWVNCNANYAPIPGANASSYTASNSGSFAVVISQGGCSDTSACYVISNVGIDDVASENVVAVFPNPGNSHFTLKSTSDYSHASIRVVNALGQVIHRIESSNNEQIQFSIEGEPGIYFVVLDSDDNHHVVKLLKSSSIN